MVARNDINYGADGRTNAHGAQRTYRLAWQGDHWKSQEVTPSSLTTTQQLGGWRGEFGAESWA